MPIEEFVSLRNYHEAGKNMSGIRLTSVNFFNKKVVELSKVCRTFIIIKKAFLAFLSQIAWSVISPVAQRKVVAKVTGFRIIVI